MPCGAPGAAPCRCGLAPLRPCPWGHPLPAGWLRPPPVPGCPFLTPSKSQAMLGRGVGAPVQAGHGVVGMLRPPAAPLPGPSQVGVHPGRTPRSRWHQLLGTEQVGALLPTPSVTTPACLGPSWPCKTGGTGPSCLPPSASATCWGLPACVEPGLSRQPPLSQCSCTRPPRASPPSATCSARP